MIEEVGGVFVVRERARPRLCRRAPLPPRHEVRRDAPFLTDLNPRFREQRLDDVVAIDVPKAGSRTKVEVFLSAFTR